MNPQNQTNTPLQGILRVTPRDFFLHLGATIALYVSVIALVNLVLSIINYTFPDQLAGYFFANTVAWPISMLIVLVPVLYVLEWLIRKDILATPEKDSLFIRRWRIFLTLFLAGATIIGDLIALINTYLNGEISIRFFYKFLAVLIIFGVVFAYYLLDKVAVKRAAQKALAWVGIVLVLVAIVGGFLVVGSPAKQRAMRFDIQRVNDLQSIQWQIVNYWQQKGTLPATLADLGDPISGSYTPLDPETDTPYEYSVKGATSFDLCSTFALETQDTKGRGQYGDMGYTTSISYPHRGGGELENWKHGEGRTCFTRTIDPDIYAPFPKDPRPL